MYLDPRTLQVAAIVVCCVLGPVSLAFAPAERTMQPCRFWGGGLIALAGGLALASLRGYEADFVSQVFGPALLALALTLAQTSARSVLGQDWRDLAGWALLALFILILAALAWASADAWLQELLGMGMLALLAFRVAYAFYEGQELPEVGAMRTIGVIFGLFGVSLLLQAVLEPGAADEMMLVGLIAGVLLGTIVLLWVMTERINSRMRQLVSLDPLTGALNRPTLAQQFEKETSRTRRRSDAQFTILLIDIDEFRRVNDAYGHEAGDRLLQKTAEILRGMSREYDLVGRLEGDAFVLLTPGVRSDAAGSIAERVRREIELQAWVRAQLKNRVTVSIGVATFGVHGVDWDTMLRAAGAAVRIAKTFGGNRVEAAEPMENSPGTAPGEEEQRA